MAALAAAVPWHSHASAAARACCAAEDRGGKEIEAASRRDCVDARGFGGIRHWWLYQTSEDRHGRTLLHDLDDFAFYWARAQRISCRRCRLATGCFTGLEVRRIIRFDGVKRKS